MKQKNNKGFSLIELIVATAILGIVVLGAGGFMLSGANSFQLVYTNIGLQYTAQQTENQMQEVIVDCDTAVWADGGALYLADRQADGSYIVYAYTLSDEELRFQKVSGAAAGGVSAMSVSGSETHTLARDVQELHTSVEQDAVTGRAVTITCTLVFERQGKAYTSVQTIALRNNPAAASTLDELIDACE